MAAGARLGGGGRTGWRRGPGARSTRAWWPRSRRTRTPASPRSCAGERPLVVALDEVTDPHNLGAVARVAECAGAGGLVITRRRSAAVTAAVCRASAGRRRAPADRARRESGPVPDRHPPARPLELRGRRRRGHRLPRGRLPRRGGVRARGGGAGPAAAGAVVVRPGGVDRPRRADRVAERVDGGGRAPLRGAEAARRWLTTSTSSTATTSPTSAAPGSDYVRAREQLVGDVAGFASEAGIDVVLVFDGEGRGRQIGRVRVVHSGRETADTVIERLAHRRAGEDASAAASRSSRTTPSCGTWRSAGECTR